MFVFNAGVNLDEIVRAVNQVGAAPGDLVAILEALKQAGALRAELDRDLSMDARHRDDRSQLRACLRGLPPVWRR